MPSSTDLTYRLYDTAPDLGALRVVDTRLADWAGRDVTFHILGASHAVLIREGDTRLAEVLSCAGPASAQALAEAVVSDGATDTSAVLHGIRVRGRVTRESGAAPLLSGAFVPQDMMTAAFPIPGQDGSAMTIVAWRTDPRELLVETIHAYPEEDCIVRSITTFQAVEENR